MIPMGKPLSKYYQGTIAAMRAGNGCGKIPCAHIECHECPMRQYKHKNTTRWLKIKLGFMDPLEKEIEKFEDVLRERS